MEILPANIILDSWKKKVWMCKRENKIVSKIDMLELLNKHKEIHTRNYCNNIINTKLLKESIEKIEGKLLSNKSKKQIKKTIQFLKMKLTQIYKLLVQRMVLPSTTKL